MFPGVRAKQLLPSHHSSDAEFNFQYYYKPSSDDCYFENNDTRVWKGPRKVARFCLLAVILPCVLVSVALLMRFVVHGSAIYHLSPSDMRILDHRISTIWCQSEVVKGNISFTTYVTNGEPEMIKSSEPVVVERNIIVPDDHKEFWGFYLLKDSTFRVYTCARFKGGTLLVVRGRNHLEHCAYIGESDSAGNSDEFPSSNSREKGTKPDPALGPSSKEEMGEILSKIRHYIRSRPKNYNQLKQNLANWMLIDKSGEQKETTTPITSTSTSQTILLNSAKNNLNETVVQFKNVTGISHSLENQIIEHGSILRRRRQVELRKDTESGENGAFEEMDPVSVKEAKTGGESHSVWSQEHEHQHGILNDTADPTDGSDSESESSWSSSEEAMAKCEGVLGNFVLKANDTCGDPDNDNWDMEPFYEGTVNVSGYYYFIFGSENEKRDNIIRAKFQLEKYIYHLPQPMPNCTNVKECQVNFTFSSNEKLVITVPQPIANPAAWNENYIAESECRPRTLLYLVFVILVPLVILLCAFQ